MKVKEQIDEYIAGLSEPKRGEMQELHDRVIRLAPGCKLWFLEGRNDDGKVVSNPSIGYGSRFHKYADGIVREFYRIGLSANKSGISVYILGIDDKKFLAETYGKNIGKADVTGYCIKFKKLEDIYLEVLGSAIRFGLEKI